MVNESSVTIIFNEQLDLKKLKLGIFKKFGDAKPLEQDGKRLAIAIHSKNNNCMYVLSEKTLNAKKIGTGDGELSSSIVDLAEAILKNLKLESTGFEKTDVSVRFNKKYSIPKKIITKTFRDKLNKILKEEGYETPDYTAMNLFLKKEGKVSTLTFGYSNSGDYAKEEMFIDCPEELKEKLQKL